MIKEVNEDLWNKHIHIKRNSIFFNSVFLNSIASEFNCQLHYFVFEDVKEILMQAALFSDGKNIVTALPYTYSSISYSPTLSDKKYLEITNEFLGFLKRRWKKIALRLPVEIRDIRPYVWENFKIDNRYTYLKNTSTGFNGDVLKSARRSARSGIILQVLEAQKSDIELCITSLAKQGYQNTFIKNNLGALNALAGQGKLLAFRGKLGELTVCTSLMVVDKKERKGYALLISDALQPNAHTFINVERSFWCTQNAISIIDFCGANECGLAMFKSKFNASLTPYFIVSYNPLQKSINTLIVKFKSLIKKILF